MFSYLYDEKMFGYCIVVSEWKETHQKIDMPGHDGICSLTKVVVQI